MVTQGLHADIPELEYHADTVSLSVSGAKTLLKSPALFRHNQEHPPFKDVWEFGSAVHAIVLGSGMEAIYVTPCDDWRTKAAQDERRIAREERLSPITPSEWETACDMADALALHPIAGKLFSGGNPEVSAYCIDDETGVMRRARFDYLRDDLIVDYKTDRTSDPREFGRTAANFGYAQQAAWYLDIAHDLGHDVRGFLFVVQMKEPPYLVSVCELTADAIDRGRDLNHRALEMFRDCTESGIWPGWGDGIHRIDLPAWAYYDKQETA